MSKSSSKKPTQVVYAMALYSGVIKSGYCYVQVTTSHPETEFEKLRPYYGKDVKGRWVKSVKSQESLEEALKEKLSEHEYSDFFYKLSTTDVVKVLKEVFSCNKCTTMGIYDKEEDEEEAAAPAAPAAPKVTEKKAAAKAEPKVEAKEEPKSKSKSETKKEPKVEEKSTKSKASKKEKQPVSEDEEDTKKKVVKSKSSTKTQIVLSDSEEELEEEE